MSASARRHRLVLAGLGLALVMSVLVPVATHGFGPMAGYLAVMFLYWTGFCVPVAIFLGDGPHLVRVRLDRSPRWIVFVSLLLPLLVLIAAGSSAWTQAPRRIVAVALGAALINGPLEELAWRRAYRANSGERLPFELLGLGLFTLWHVPLYFAEGVTFDYGAVGLIGSPLALGAVWMTMTRRSDSVGWPVVSHTLVNAAAFVPFFTGGFSG